MEGHITCVICPVGCKVFVRKDGVHFTIEGNRCPRGEEYARNELMMPKRVLTTSIGVIKRYATAGLCEDRETDR
jgi:CxxC motif-containing protein